MRKSTMTLGLIAGALIAASFPRLAVAQDSTQPPVAPPPPTSPPPDSSAPAANVAMTGPSAGAAPALTGFSVFGIVGYLGSIGGGARYMIPVGIPALLTHTRFRDSWAVEFGADLLYWSDTFAGTGFHETELIPIAGLMWNVWLTPQFAVYPKAEIGFGLDVGGSTYGNFGDHSGIYPSGAAGLLYQVSKTITLRAEVGSTGLRGGAGFFF